VGDMIFSCGRYRLAVADFVVAYMVAPPFTARPKLCKGGSTKHGLDIMNRPADVFLQGLQCTVKPVQ